MNAGPSRPPTGLRRLAAALVVALGLAGALGIAGAYLHPDLRQAVAFAGFGLC